MYSNVKRWAGTHLNMDSTLRSQPPVTPQHPASRDKRYPVIAHEMTHTHSISYETFIVESVLTFGQT